MLLTYFFVTIKYILIYAQLHQVTPPIKQVLEGNFSYIHTKKHSDKSLYNIQLSLSMIQQQPTNTLSQYKPFKISSILFIVFICIVIILTALTRTSVCNKYDCYQFGASYDRQCYSFSTIYCCNYIYIFCGDAYCIPVQHHSNTYGNDCEGMLVALWVFLTLCGLAILAIIGAAYAYRKKADADIKLAHRSSSYVPPPQNPINLSSNQMASGRGEQDAGGNSSMRRQSSAMFNLQNQVLLL